MTLNDLYKKTLENIWINGKESSPRSMKIKELMAHTLVLDNPKDNIITIPEFETNLNYAKEELEWYKSGRNDIKFSPLIKKVWEKYSDDKKTVNSAYGFYMFNNKFKQWDWIKNKLKEDLDTRQAVININQFYHKNDLTKDFPCTIYCQVLVRDKKLNWITNMRSNDIYLGFRNDLYCFTELQQKLAKELNLELGSYYHFASSLHLYEQQFEKVKNLLKNDK